MKRIVLLAILLYVLAAPAATLPASAGLCMSQVTPAWGSVAPTDVCIP